MAITFVAAGTAFSRIGSGTTFTWNKPAGVAAGDMLVASVQFEANSSQRTVTLPSGWTLVKNVFNQADGRNLQLTVAYRIAASGDGSSWGGTISANVLLTAASVSAYRGVQSVGASGTSTADVDTSYSTATVNNSAANSWRVVCASYLSGTTSYTISSNEATRRILFAADDSGSTGACQAAIWDSNASVSTGNTSRTVSRSGNWSTSCSVILLLSPSLGTPASGVWASTLAKVSASASGDVHDDATVSASIPKVVALADGYGQPIAASGTLGASLAPVSASVDVSMAASGTLDTILPIGVNILTETRVFGVRVVNVEADDRTIVVESRGVAD
jgi:hypothetical protein